MKNYEKKAFLQIFFGYFVSITIFILLLGMLYFNQQKTYVMQKMAMNMHQYLLKLKQSNFQYTKDGYSYKLVQKVEVKKQLPHKTGDYYSKAFSSEIIILLKSKIVDDELQEIRNFTIMLQVLIIVVFAFISYILSKQSLRPMIDTISHLDRFVSDLIHDLNTPITSILLNTKMLKKDTLDKNIPKINRIENSAKNISLLYANLEILLNETQLKKEQLNLSQIIKEIIETHKTLYPNIKFNFENDDIIINSNEIAIKRILENIMSNACKYSIQQNPTINIFYSQNILTIQDNGKGIKYPQRIFERNYKENTNGHGIGMHIVHRLCSELSIKIDIKSKNGTIVKLEIA